MKVTVKKIKIDEYNFDADNNPYEHDSTTQPITLADIAQQISVEIDDLFAHHRVIIRGIQSGKYAVDKDVLLRAIIKDSQEYKNIDEPNTIFATLFEGKATIQHILEGFHKYKPKSKERPQYPIDVWLIFDAGAYENVEYLHQRHNVLARDKWKRIDPTNAGLLEVVVVS